MYRDLLSRNLPEEGEAFILEAADAFEREVAQLGQSICSWRF